MKTTLNLDDALVRSAKAHAAHHGSTLTRLIEEGLRLRLNARRKLAAAPLPKLAVSKMKGGMLPGIDPLSNRSMLDAADGL